VNRPSSAIGKLAVFCGVRAFPRARPAITAPSRSPLTRDSIISSGPVPVMPEATGPSLMPADSSVLPSRWIPEVRAWTVLILYRVRSRISFSSGGGRQEPCSSPHSNSSAIRAQSFAPVFCPLIALTCAGLTTGTSSKSSSISA